MATSRDPSLRPTAVPAAIAAVFLALITTVPGVAVLPRVGAAHGFQSAAPAPSTCVAQVTKVAEPGVVAPGGLVTVQLSIALEACPGAGDPIHLVLVLDASGSMAGQTGQSSKSAAIAMIDGLALRDHPLTRVGVVSFNDHAKELCALTNDAALATKCVGRVSASLGTCIDCGVRAALDTLRHGRSTAMDPQRVREYIVLVSDGENNAGCAALLAQADQVRTQNIVMFSICVGSACDLACMRAAATEPRFVFEDPSASGKLMTGIMDNIRGLVVGQWLRTLTITDTLSAGMTLIEASTDPPADIGADGRTVVWRFRNVSLPDVTVQLKIRVPSAGRYPTNDFASADWTDSHGGRGTATFPVPFVDVIDHPPTRTASPPTATRTATTIPPSAPTATSSPSDAPSACPRLTNRLPRAAIDAALADPTRVGGWGVPCRVGQPVGPMNPLRRWLDLRNANLPWHPVFNGVVFKCGCG